MSSPADANAKDKDPHIGRLLAGRYRILRLCGHGGMGSVYEALHATTDKKVAVKVLSPQLGKDLKLVARFRREAMAASRLEHENCVHVDDFGEASDGTFYIAMEYVDGHGLADELRKSGPLSPDRVVRIGEQLLKALDAAHASGVLHRDLKPQNVMLTHKPQRPDIVKVVDFGIAKITTNSPEDQGALTVPGTIFGTPEYMSPEQARGETLDTRSDLYSAAVVLWHMLLGRSPFRGTSVRETLLKVFSEVAPSPAKERPAAGIPPGLEEALQKALCKRKEDRYPDAASFLEALRPFAKMPFDVPRRPQPGLPQQGEPSPPTLDAVGPSTLPLDAAVVPVVPPPPRPAPAAPSSAAPPAPPGGTQPSTAVAAFPITPQPGRASGGMKVVGASVTPPPQAPSKPPPPASLPDGPRATRVVSADAVKRATTAVEAPPALAPPPPPARRKQQASAGVVAALVGGVVVLVVFVVVIVVVAMKYSAPQGGVIDRPVDAPVAAQGGDEPTASDNPTASPPPDGAGLLPVSASVDPLARDAALGRADRALEEHKLHDARAAYEEALRADDQSARALSGLALVAFQQKDYPTAQLAFERVMAQSEQHRRQFAGMYNLVKKRLADQGR